MDSCNFQIQLLTVQIHSLMLLNWVKQNYIRAETLARANARLVDYQSTIPLAKKWGVEKWPPQMV